MTISQKKSWVKYENGEFTTALQSKKGSGDNWLPVVYLNTPTPELSKQLKIKPDGQNVVYVIYGTRDMCEKDIEHTTTYG